MKKQIIFLSILTIGLFSCKKEELQSNNTDRKVTYTVMCNTCTIKVPSALDQTPTYLVTGQWTKTYDTEKFFVSEIELTTTRTDVTPFQFSISVNGSNKKSVAGFISATNGYKSNDLID